MISCVVFDLGGVVLEVDFARFFSHLPEDSGKVAREQSSRLVQVFRRYEDQAGEFPPESVFDSIREVIGHPLENDQIISAINAILGPQKQDVCEVISVLARHTRVACLSNTNHLHWEVLLRDYPAMNLFEVKMASHLMNCAKPDVRIYEQAAGILQLPPGELLFFDDKVENVDAARRCGWNACVFRDSSRFVADLESFGLAVS